MTGRDWATLFNETFTAPVSVAAARIWSEVFGDEYPAKLDIYSFVSISELNRFVGELRLSPGDVLADVGCGRGGPGLWVATQTGAHLIGIDIAETRSMRLEVERWPSESQNARSFTSGHSRTPGYPTRASTLL